MLFNLVILTAIASEHFVQAVQWPHDHLANRGGAMFETLSVNVSKPTNNAPLNKELVYYRLKGANGKQSQLTHSFIEVSCGAVMSVHHTDPHVFSNPGSKETPILLLNHGYPESSYVWREVTPEICSRAPCIVPDRPGYGLSTKCPNGTDERTTSGAIVDIATKLYGPGKNVVLVGHDRGGRTMHRLAVDASHGGFPSVKALGVFIVDIVPTFEEYKTFSNPNASTGLFFWNLMPRNQGGFSTNVIMAYGGGNWVDFINTAGSGTNETGIARFRAGNAFEIYHNFFDQLSVTNASVLDYHAGATIDYLEQVADQAAGRKIRIPTHVEYSQFNLVTGAGLNVEEIWSNWTDPSAGLTTEAILGGQGHYLPELAPQETLGQLNAFLDRLSVTRKPRVA